MRNYRSALILLGVLGILTGLAYWDDWKTAQDEKAKQNEKKITSILKENVIELSVNSAESDFTLKKAAGKWGVVSPIISKADSTSVDSLVDTVTSYQFKTKINNPSNLDDFGLKDPKRVIVLKTKDSQVEIKIGSKVPTGFSVYSQIAGTNSVLIGSQHLLSATAKKLNDLRDKSIFPSDMGNIMELNVGGIGISVNKDGYLLSNGWHADKSEVQNLIDSIKSLKATAFIDEPRPSLFKTGVKKISITNEKSNRFDLSVVSRENGEKVYVSFDPNERSFEVEKSFFDKISKTNSDLRDKRIVKFSSADQIAEIKIDKESYVRLNDKFYRKSELDGKNPKGSAIQHITDFVVDLEFAKANTFLKPEKRKSPPSHTIEITYKDGLPVKNETIDVWLDDEPVVKTDLVVAKVDKSTFSNIKPKEKESVSK